MQLCQAPCFSIKAIVAQDVKVPDSQESLDNLSLFSWLCDDCKLILRFQKQSNPICKIPFDCHPKTSFDKAIFDVWSSVNDVLFLINHLFEFFSRNGFFTFFENLFKWRFGALLIQLCIMEEVLWRSWKAISNFLNEFLSIFNQKSVIFLMLSFQCTEISWSDWFSTGWTWTVAWIKPKAFVQGLKFFNRIVKHSSQICRSYVWSHGQIGSANFS